MDDCFGTDQYTINKGRYPLFSDMQTNDRTAGRYARADDYRSQSYDKRTLAVPTAHLVDDIDDKFRFEQYGQPAYYHKCECATCKKVRGPMQYVMPQYGDAPRFEHMKAGRHTSEDKKQESSIVCIDERTLVWILFFIMIVFIAYVCNRLTEMHTQIKALRRSMRDHK